MTPMTPITSDLLSGTRHGFFTRAGGVSQGIYASLNGGLGSDDGPEQVAENRARIARHMGAGHLITVHQVHSAEAVAVTGPWPDRAPKADALVTDRPGLALAALTADCTPQQAVLLGRHAAVSFDARGRLVLKPQSTRVRREAARLGLYERIGRCLAEARWAPGVALDDNLLPPAPRGGAVELGALLPDEEDQRLAESLGIGLVGPRQCSAVGFLHTVMAQLGLPRARVLNPDGTDAWRFERGSGRVSMLVTVGEARIGKGGRWRTLQLPYGSKPRLMLMDICTRAVRTGSATVDMGSSVRGYLERNLGLEWGGGPRGQYTHFRRQALNLVACTVRLGVDYPDRSMVYSGGIVDAFAAWTLDEDGEQLPLWPAALHLHNRFFEALREFGVPLDMRAYQALSRAPLAMDAYTWLAHRLHRIDGSVDIRWESLHRDFGAEYGRLRDFRRAFTRALRKAQAVYPQAVDRIHSIEGGIRLYAAQPPVPPLPRRA